MIGTTPRSDGKTQVTYNGHPVYRFQGDRRPATRTARASWRSAPAGRAVPGRGQVTGASSSSGGSGYSAATLGGWLSAARPAQATRRVPAAYALGALMLAGEAAVHVQQYASVVHGVRWIGPLFLANAALVVAAIAGLAYPRTRQLAALAGVVISVAALASLVVSYGEGCSAAEAASAQPSHSP